MGEHHDTYFLMMRVAELEARVAKLEMEVALRKLASYREDPDAPVAALDAEEVGGDG
jgi:hypothetical protein